MPLSASLFKKITVVALLLFVSTTISTLAQVGDLIWEDNFDNLENWIIETGNGSWGWGNGELQYYSPNNVSIAAIDGDEGNNALRIIAKRESGPEITDQWGNQLDFTSGRLNTKSKVSMQFGMVETRIQVPDLITGGWPAFWLLGTTNFGWPTSGELDLMEMGFRQESRDGRDSTALTSSTENQMTAANAIFYTENAIVPGNPSGAASVAFDREFTSPYYNIENPLNDRFLIYRMYWDSTSIQFTVEDNGVEYDLFRNPFEISDESDEFLKPFYFIVNMAIGGTLTDAYQLGDPGSGEQVSMALPAEMLVDYVRVYEWNNQGTVQLGPPSPKTETFALYSDLRETKDSLTIDEDAFIYVWEGTLTGGSIDPLEGDGVLSWKSAGSGWFGAGILSEQPTNLSQFTDGFLNFSIKIPANVSFQIGVTDAWGNQNYVDFPANQTVFGLERNGEWGRAQIPVSDLRGQFIDLRMLAYSFVILEVNGASAEFGIDDIYYDNGLINSTENLEISDPISNFQLYNNYPNPFNPVTNIQYELPIAGNVELSIYNLQGQKVATLINATQNAGIHLAQWDASGYSSGIYFYRLTTESGFTETKSLVLLK